MGQETKGTWIGWYLEVVVYVEAVTRGRFARVDGVAGAVAGVWHGGLSSAGVEGGERWQQRAKSIGVEAEA